MNSQFVVTALLIAFVFSAQIHQGDAYTRQPVKLMRYGNSLPAYAPYALYRFYNSRQAGSHTLDKRNNAEVVNHILKNFGTLDRLGDVGRR